MISLREFVWKDSLMWEGARDMFVIVLEKMVCLLLYTMYCTYEYSKSKKRDTLLKNNEKVQGCQDRICM